MLNEKSRYYGQTKVIDVDSLRALFDTEVFDYIDMVLLFGSRATENFHKRSDYDFAVLVKDIEVDEWGTLSKVWSDVGTVLGLDEVDYDIIDLKEATLEMKNSIKNGYITLKGMDNDISRILG